MVAQNNCIMYSRNFICTVLPLVATYSSVTTMESEGTVQIYSSKNESTRHSVYNPGRQDSPQMKILLLNKSDCRSALAWITTNHPRYRSVKVEFKFRSDRCSLIQAVTGPDGGGPVPVPWLRGGLPSAQLKCEVVGDLAQVC